MSDGKGTWLAGAVGTLVMAVLLGSVLSFGATVEVPMGGLKGTVTMKENGRALPNAEVIALAKFDLPEGVTTHWTTRTKSDGSFTFHGLPAGAYEIDAYGKAHHNQDRCVAIVSEGKSSTEEIKTDRTLPDVDLQVNQRVFLPDEKPDITISGYTDSPTADVRVYSVPFESVFNKKSPENLVRSVFENQNESDPAKIAGLESVWTQSYKLNSKDVEGHFVEQAHLAPLPEGMYLVRASIGEYVRYGWLTVSKIALVSKIGKRDCLAFVTDLKSGTPVAGIPVSYAKGSSSVSAGKTGPDGLLRFPYTAPDAPSIFFAQSGNSRAITWSYGGNEDHEGKTVLWAQTDRPVYRPGDRVQYKVVARDTVGDGYQVSRGPLHITIKDPDEVTVTEQTVTLSADGMASGQFQTDAEALPGDYEITMEHGDSQETHYVSIVSYRKPEYRVTVKAERKSYIRGEFAHFKVHVETYTGEPAVGANLTATLYRAPYWDYSPFDDENSYEEDDTETDYYGDFVRDLDGITDENGDYSVSVPTTDAKWEKENLTDADLTLEASVQDARGTAVDGHASTLVTRGEFDISVDADRYIVSPGEKVKARIKATWNADDSPVAGLEVAVKGGHLRWLHEDTVFVQENQQTVRLDQNGEASVELTAQETAMYQVDVSAVDRRGNSVESQLQCWVDTGSFDYEGPTPDMQLTLDKESYDPSDAAKLLIRTQHPGGVALLTVEADGILSTRTVSLEHNATTVELTGLEKYSPNAIIAISYVRDKEYYEAQRNINVSLALKKLQVTVTPDVSTVLPGGQVRYTVSTKDSSGRPVRANVAVGVVDESVFAIAEDRNDPITSFYPRRWSSVTTSYSFPMLYMDGEDKNPHAVRIRKKFEDTAYWNPNVETDTNGMAEVTVRLPDNLTEWRATATAFTDDTQIGKTKSSVVVKKDVMARLSLPSFLVEGDTQTIAGRVSNTTGSMMPMTVKLTLDNADIVEGAPDRQADVGANGTREFVWKIRPRDVGQASFRLTAASSTGPDDGVEQKVPVLVHGHKAVSFAVGDTTNSASFDLSASQASVKYKLTLHLSPSILGSLTQALPSLIDYPYGCAEQTMSRFLPSVLVAKLMKDHGLSDPRLAELPKIIRESLGRLRRMQTDSGGWGWWEYSQPDDWMTAYVLEGLYRVRSAGVSVAPLDTDKALDWAEKELAKPDPTPYPNLEYDSEWSRRVELAASVLLYKPSNVATGVFQRAVKAKKVSTQALSRAIVALSRHPNDPLLQEAYGQLMSQAVETKDTLHWQDDGWYEATGSALEALVSVEPESPKIGKVFRYLMGARRGTEWTSTRDTARVLVSAAAYLSRTKEPVSSSPVTVQVNGTTVSTVDFSNPKNLGGATVTVPMSDLRRGSNQVSIQLAGSGKVYYDATLEQQVRDDKLSAESTAKDFSLQRTFHTVKAERLQDGTLRLVVSEQPASQFHSGDVVRCRLTVSCTHLLDRAILEVPIPSNCRIVDDDEPLDGLTWEWWWDRSVFLDDRAVFFGSFEPGKPRVIEFALRAESPGVCVALPASLNRMYQPDEKASTAGLAVEVLPK